MITLITYRAGFGQLSYSPFCVKAMWLLQAADMTWQREDNDDPRKMPYAKLPAIRVDGQIIGDSHNIQSYLEGQGADFWGDLSAGDRAIGHSFIRMVEEHMYFHLVLDRWENAENWPVIRDAYFAAVPRLLRRPITALIRRDLLKGLSTQGIARFNPAERLERLEKDFVAIATQLGDNPYLLGNKISLPDYSVAAMLGIAMASPQPTALSERVNNDPTLKDYATRVADRMTA